MRWVAAVHPIAAHEARLWAGILLAPTVWFADLLVSYALVSAACAAGHRMILVGVTVVALAAAGAGVLLAWRTWRGVPPPDGRGGGAERRRFMEIGGLALSLGFWLVILVQNVPAVVLSPCD